VGATDVLPDLQPATKIHREGLLLPGVQAGVENMNFEEYVGMQVKMVYNDDPNENPRWQKSVRGVVESADEFITIKSNSGFRVAVRKDRVISLRETEQSINASRQ
jgi:hypothetical protein|tara:strand:+ start:4311 stop:4625 length:315 start_codon:yes stop_codon:yes gene_type:complete